MQGVLHQAGLQDVELQQILGRRGRQRVVLFGRERGESVTRLRRDHDAAAATRDRVAEELEHEGCAVQVDLQNRFDGRL